MPPSSAGRQFPTFINEYSIIFHVALIKIFFLNELGGIPILVGTYSAENDSFKIVSTVWELLH